MSIISLNENTINNKLLHLLTHELNNEEQQLFINSFYGFLNHDQEKDFVVDLDTIYEWVGFTRKDPAKRLLLNKFTENIDYKIFTGSIENFPPPQSGGKRNSSETRGGSNKETIMLTINTFKKFCMKADTKQADKIHDYFIKMENINQKYILQKSNEKDKLLQQKNQELIKYQTLTYEEVEKTGHVYILTTDKQCIYKCGRAKDVNKRIKCLQTGNVEDIEIVYDYPTSNDVLLESVVHFVLDRYRSNSNREHFRCDIEYMKLVIQTVGKMIDTLKSSFETISKEELLDKLGYTQPLLPKETPKEISKMENNQFYKLLNENRAKIAMMPNNGLNLRDHKKFRCNICLSNFNQKSNLNRHLIEKRCKSPLLNNLIKLNDLFSLNN